MGERSKSNWITFGAMWLCSWAGVMDIFDAVIYGDGVKLQVGLLMIAAGAVVRWIFWSKG